MSLAAIFVFLLVSALQMLDGVLDLARRVGATCHECSFLFPVPDFFFEEKIRF
jgi:hypothetical protein